MFGLKNLFGAVVLLSAMVMLSSAVSGQIYGGRGIGFSATVNNGSPTSYVFADTGELPMTGGNISISAPTSAVSGLSTTGVLTSSSSGALRSSQTVTVANDVYIIIGGVVIRANRVTANSGCICCPGVGDGTCGGSSSFNGLTVTDQAGNTTNVSYSGTANQVVNLPNGIGTLTLNQQINGTGTITVNGLRVNATANGSTYDVIVAGATSAIECLTTGPTPAPVTVGGRVLDRYGRGVSGAIVRITDNAGNSRNTTTNSTGYYTFTEVELGSYVFEVTAGRYTFSPKVVDISNDTKVDFVSN